MFIVCVIYKRHLAPLNIFQKFDNQYFSTLSTNSILCKKCQIFCHFFTENILIYWSLSEAEVFGQRPVNVADVVGEADNEGRHGGPAQRREQLVDQGALLVGPEVLVPDGPVLCAD
jgi:hypothetical protein